jgi:hypothetical protein
MQFMTKNTSVNEISIGYNNVFISNTSNTKLLGLVTANSLSWTDHITQLNYVKYAMYLDVLDYLCVRIH